MTQSTRRRRFASLRVLNATTGEVLPYQTVEIDEKGEALGCFPIQAEKPSTVWVEGLIVLSRCMASPRRGETFAEFTDRLRKMNGELSSPIRLFVVAPFNLARMELTERSRAVSL